MENFDLKKYLAENKLLKEYIDFPEMEEEFEGAMDAMVVEPEVYLQDIINASPEEIVSDDYYEIMNAVEQGVYSAEEAVELAKSWAKEKLTGLSENKLLKEDANSIVNLLMKNQREVAEKTMNTEYFPFDNVNLDSMGDASITLKDEAGGMSFKYPEDVDSEFVGQEGDKPRPITIGGVDLMYVGYNI